MDINCSHQILEHPRGEITLIPGIILSYNHYPSVIFPTEALSTAVTASHDLTLRSRPKQAVVQCFRRRATGTGVRQTPVKETGFPFVF